MHSLRFEICALQDFRFALFYHLNQGLEFLLQYEENTQMINFITLLNNYVCFVVVVDLVFLDNNDSFCFCLYVCLFFCFVFLFCFGFLFLFFFFYFWVDVKHKTNLEWLYYLNRDKKGEKIKKSNRIASKKNQHSMVTRDKI